MRTVPLQTRGINVDQNCGPPPHIHSLTRSVDRRSWLQASKQASKQCGSSHLDSLVLAARDQVVLARRTPIDAIDLGVVGRDERQRRCLFLHVRTQVRASNQCRRWIMASQHRGSSSARVARHVRECPTREPHRCDTRRVRWRCVDSSVSASLPRSTSRRSWSLRAAWAFVRPTDECWCRLSTSQSTHANTHTTMRERDRYVSDSVIARTHALDESTVRCCYQIDSNSSHERVFSVCRGTFDGSPTSSASSASRYQAVDINWYRTVNELAQTQDTAFEQLQCPIAAVDCCSIEMGAHAIE